jgi:hypothetical protein
MSENEERPDGAPSDSVADVGLIDEMLRMSPSERLRQNDRMAALAVRLREAFVAGEGEWKTRGS